MSKIFLCGNGINIKFNKKYALNEFIDLLIHDEMLKNFVQNYNFRYDISLDNNDYFEREKNLNEFLKIIKKFKFEILEAKNKLSKNGVEAVIKDLFMAFIPLCTIFKFYHINGDKSLPRKLSPHVFKSNTKLQFQN